MKIAISIFENRVAPRFEFSPEMWIIDVENRVVMKKEKLWTANLNIAQRLEKISSNGVSKIICGGIDGFCVNRFKSKGIDVVQDVMGEAEVAFELFMKGGLQRGFCCEGKEGRSTWSWKRGFCRRRKTDGERKD